MKTLKITSMAMVIAAFMFGFTSCQKEDIQPAPATPTQAGDFKVKMTDAPGDYAALDVEITGVDAYLENSGWVSLSNETQQVSVLSLTNGVETLLAYNGSVEVGTYSKLRITFGEQNTLTLNGSSSAGGVSGSGSATVELMWDKPKEVIIEIDEQVSANAGAEVLLDFQVVESIREQAQEYIIDPVITEIKDASTGLKGEVQGTANAAVILTDGTNEFSTYIDASGNFLIRGMDEGMYDLIVMPDKNDLGLPQDQRLESVIISKGEIKHIGTINF